MAPHTANKILVIDDDSDILDFLMAILHDEVSLSFASEGTKALELVDQHKPDLILLDVVMPGMDGFEVCKHLKENPKTQHIPVIFLTGKADGKDMAQGLALGAVDYMTKPFDPEIVAAKLHNILKQITATRAAAKPVEKEPFVPGGGTDRRAEGSNRPDRFPKDPNGRPAGERRAEGARRPDRYQKTETDNGPVVERRAQGAERPDRFHKPVQKTSGMSLPQFLVIAVIIAATAGGGYAWYNKGTFENPMGTPSGDGATSEASSEAPSQNFDLSESDIQAVIAEAHEPPATLSASNQAAPEPSVPSMDSKTNSCGDIPKVPWWGNASHGSITAYVNNRNSGNWKEYIAKWNGQLDKLKKVYAKDGTVIAPKIGTRLKGPVLAEYISQVEKRLEVTRCLAAKMAEN